MAHQADAPVALGIDIGSSGVRIIAVDMAATPAGMATWRFERANDMADPKAWWRGVEACMDQLRDTVAFDDIAAISVDGTSGSVLAVDGEGIPLGPALMYNQPVPEPAIAERVDAAAPNDSPARGAYSALARAIHLAAAFPKSTLLHQADWIVQQLGGDAAVSDENNTLKTGYDLQAAQWPDWLEDAGMEISRLPAVVPAGTVIGTLGARGRALGLPAGARLVSGTTDGCASFLATGAAQLGDAVTALGSTLVLKLLSDREIRAPQHGIYSHRLLGLWLAGGASNTGGAVLAHHFDAGRMQELTARLDPEVATGLDYYPLLTPGERFPTNDPGLTPRLTPRPEDDAQFFQGMLEAMARIEAEGYQRLSELGAPPLTSIRTVGGGAGNAAWTRIRRSRLGAPLVEAVSGDAAMGSARLALRGIAQ